MYEYKYVHVEMGGLFTSKLEGHQKAITQAAEEGWRYVGYLPTYMSNHGALITMDLVFERPLEAVSDGAENPFKSDS